MKLTWISRERGWDATTRAGAVGELEGRDDPALPPLLVAASSSPPSCWRHAGTREGSTTAVGEGRRGGDGWAAGPARGAAASTGSVVEGAGERTGSGSGGGGSGGGGAGEGASDGARRPGRRFGGCSPSGARA